MSQSENENGLSFGHSNVAMASNQSLQRVFGWGSCSKGQLGLGQEVNSIPAPTEIKDLEGSQVVSLSAQAEKSALVNEFGELYTWGSSKNNSFLDA